MNPYDTHDPVIGGVDLPEKHVRRDVVFPDDLVWKDEIDRRILRLMALHPNLKSGFRNRNSLADLDIATKSLLLNDMNRILEIRPLGVPEE